jgi:hypothetical protein
MLSAKCLRPRRLPWANCVSRSLFVQKETTGDRTLVACGLHSALSECEDDMADVQRHVVGECRRDRLLPQRCVRFSAAPGERSLPLRVFHSGHVCSRDGAGIGRGSASGCGKSRTARAVHSHQPGRGFVRVSPGDECLFRRQRETARAVAQAETPGVDHEHVGWRGKSEHVGIFPIGSRLQRAIGSRDHGGELPPQSLAGGFREDVPSQPFDIQAQFSEALGHIAGTLAPGTAARLRGESASAYDLERDRGDVRVRL